jgi:hypothetical protein
MRVSSCRYQLSPKSLLRSSIDGRRHSFRQNRANSTQHQRKRQAIRRAAGELKTTQSPCPVADNQLIVSGDFFQLPPVSRPGEPDYKFAFEATCWPKLFPRENMSGLTRVFRQKEDDFVKLLEGMRKGIVRPQDTALLAKCNRQIKYDDAIEPVGL